MACAQSVLKGRQIIAPRLQKTIPYPDSFLAEHTSPTPLTERTHQHSHKALTHHPHEHRHKPLTEQTDPPEQNPRPGSSRASSGPGKIPCCAAMRPSALPPCPSHMLFCPLKSFAMPFPRRAMLVDCRTTHARSFLLNLSLPCAPNVLAVLNVCPKTSPASPSRLPGPAILAVCSTVMRGPCP